MELLTSLQVGPDFNYADGIKITFPAGIQINSAVDAGNAHNYTPVIDGQTVTWGNNNTTGDGGFSGGEDLMVNINSVEPTFTAEYVIYDDGWSEAYASTDPQYYNSSNSVHVLFATKRLDQEEPHLTGHPWQRKELEHHQG